MEELKDKFGKYEIAMDHFSIPNTEIIECDECLFFNNGGSFVDEEEHTLMKTKTSAHILLREYNLVVSLEKDKIIESDIDIVKEKLKNKLKAKLSNYPEYAVVSRINFIEPYKKTINGKIIEGLAAIFIGNLAKNPRVHISH